MRFMRGARTRTRSFGWVTQEMLEREIAKAKKAKAEHSVEKGKKRRMIGFQPS